MNKEAFSLFSTKSLSTEESGDFIVEGIASTPTLDSDNDSLNSLGASFRTIPFPFILNHDHLNPVGQVIEAEPTQQGIKVKIRIPYVKEIGKLKEQTDYAIHCIKYNIISGLSIGFSAKQSDAILNEKGGLNINAYEVYELSLTALQSNTTAFITAFKSLKQKEEITEEDNNSNDETKESVEDTTIEVISEEAEASDIVKADTQDENTKPVDVLEPEEVEESTGDTVEVKKYKSVKLGSNTKTQKQKHIKVSLRT